MIRVTNPRKFFLLLLIVGVVIVWGIFKTVWGSSNLLKSGEIEVASGQGAISVWREIVDEGYSKRVLPWRYYSWRAEAAANIKAGKYQVEEGEAIREVIERMTTGDVVPDELTLTYPEGFTLDQIAERTAARGIGTKEDFLSAAKPANFADQFPFLKDLPVGRTMEGYLFPDTYRLFAEDSSKDVIQRMVTSFDLKITDELKQEITQSGRSLDEIIIMASLLEREVIHDEDMALVSGVLWKRIDEETGLYVDATTRYILDKWDDPLTVQDLAIDSPYNTRKYRGLPPGPISNPGIRAIIAAIRPQQSEYYYYLSATDGTTIFAKTNDEHNRNKAKYLR